MLALRDFYIDKLSSVPKEPLLSPDPDCNAYLAANSSPFKQRSQDEDIWAMTYFDVSYIQPIVEVIDDDSTGFVCVREVNKFIDSKPEGWSCVSPFLLPSSDTECPPVYYVGLPSGPMARRSSDATITVILILNRMETNG